MQSNNDSVGPALTPTPLINATHRRRVSGEPEAELLQAVLDRAQITVWDVLIVGDGSGTGWDKACGWACVLVDRETRGRRLFYGAMNAGSVNFAETMPYLQAINWYDQNGGTDRLRQQGFIHVHVITDSQVIAHWGTQTAGAGSLPRKHIAMWSGLRELQRLGYRFTFHWANRSTSLLNWYSDLIAGLARRELLRLNLANEATLAVQAANALAGISFPVVAAAQDREGRSEAPQANTSISLYDLNHDEE